jgi:hypothetical protein
MLGMATLIEGRARIGFFLNRQPEVAERLPGPKPAHDQGRPEPHQTDSDRDLEGEVVR